MSDAARTVRARRLPPGRRPRRADPGRAVGRAAAAAPRAGAAAAVAALVGGAAVEPAHRAAARPDRRPGRRPAAGRTPVHRAGAGRWSAVAMAPGPAARCSGVDAGGAGRREHRWRSCASGSSTARSAAAGADRAGRVRRPHLARHRRRRAGRARPSGRRCREFARAALLIVADAGRAGRAGLAVPAGGAAAPCRSRWDRALVPARARRRSTPSSGSPPARSSSSCSTRSAARRRSARSGWPTTHTERVRPRSEHVRRTWRCAVIRLQTRFFGRLNLAEFIGLAAVLAAGFLLVRGGRATIGTASAAALYFINLFGPINQVLFLLDDAQSAAASLARLVGVADLPAEQRPADARRTRRRRVVGRAARLRLRRRPPGAARRRPGRAGRASGWRWSGRAGPASRRWPSWSRACTGPPPGTSRIGGARWPSSGRRDRAGRSR